MDDRVDLIELAERLQATCLGAGLTVATAESCTGGLVAHALIRVPGSSGYFIGGAVSYADAAKIELLGIDPMVLAAHGAVSAQVARAMADGIRRRLVTNLAVAVTGIAGPDGGSPTKPVGLTYVAVASDGGSDVRRYAWMGDRAANIDASARAALELLIVHSERINAESINAERVGTG
ncbi:MAG: CinA family protein [Candidatus Limnocylindrales bacterium]